MKNNSVTTDDNESEMEESNVEPRDTTISSMFLDIPVSITLNDCSTFMNNLAKDSTIWDGWFMEGGIKSDFEQREAGVSFASKEYCFKSKFSLHVGKDEYKTLTPRSSIFFYNNIFLALEIPLLTNNYEGVLDLYQSKYGPPQILKKDLDEIYGKTDEYIFYEYDYYTGKKVVSQCGWKDGIRSNLTEWVFNNLTIKIIYSTYAYHTISHDVYVFYINHDAIENFHENIKQEQHNRELIEKQELLEQRKRDSIENQKSKIQYNSQTI